MAPKKSFGSFLNGESDKNKDHQNGQVVIPTDNLDQMFRLLSTVVHEGVKIFKMKSSKSHSFFLF